MSDVTEDDIPNPRWTKDAKTGREILVYDPARPLTNQDPPVRVTYTYPDPPNWREERKVRRLIRRDILRATRKRWREGRK